MIPASGSRALWSPLMEDVWLFWPALNPEVRSVGVGGGGTYVTQTSQTPGGDERRAARFSLALHFRAEMCHKNTDRPVHPYRAEASCTVGIRPQTPWSWWQLSWRPALTSLSLAAGIQSDGFELWLWLIRRFKVSLLSLAGSRGRVLGCDRQ